MKSCAKAKMVRKEVIKRHLAISWSDFLKVSQNNFLQISLLQTNDTNKMFILGSVSIYFNTSLHHCVKIVQIRSFVWSLFSCWVRMKENTDQKKLRIWTLFTECIRLRSLAKHFRDLRSFRGRKNVYFQDLFSKCKHLHLSGDLLSLPDLNSKCKHLHLSVDLLPLTDLKTIFVVSIWKYIMTMSFYVSIIFKTFLWGITLRAKLSDI